MRDLCSGNYNIINENKIKESIQRVISNNKFNCYSSPKGIKELRIKISELISNLWEFQINYNNMLITTGSQQSINLVTEILLKKEETIMIEQPTYYGAIRIFRNKSINMVGINITENGIDLIELEKQIEKFKTKVIYVVPTFNNPTGYSWPNENRIEFLNIINKNNIIVIEDDPYSMINFTNEKYESLYKLNKGKNIIYLGTFSKLISPSVNVGYIIADNEFISKIYNHKEGADLCTSLFNQYVILDYLMYNNLEKEIKLKIPLYKKNAKNIQTELIKKYGEKIRFSKMKGGLFFLIDFVDCKVPEQFVCGSEYFIDNKHNNYSRINICCNQIKKA